MMSYKGEIQKNIANLENRVFYTNEFLEIADYETVRKTLNRLVNEGELQRVLRGFYYKAKYIEIIEEYESPPVHEIAQAIARKYKWTIAPSGNAALNLLGLSTQVPAKWVYVSDGSYRTFQINNITIEFKHRSNRNISNMSMNTAMVIQALKAIGKDHITPEQIEVLRRKLTSFEKRELLEAGKTVSSWIYRFIKEICEVK